MSDATVVMVIILISLLLIIIAYARNSKTRLLLCFPGREDRHQISNFSRAASSSYKKDMIAPIFRVTHNGHCESLVQTGNRPYNDGFKLFSQNAFFLRLNDALITLK